MKLFYILFVTLIVYGCGRPKVEKEKRTFDEFIFSYSEECCSYSIKFSNNDTVFMQRQFPNPNENYFAIVDRKQIDLLDSFINAIQLTRFDTMYFQNNLQDGGRYKFYLKLDTTTKWTFIYGKEGPKALYEFGDWLINFKEQVNYTRIDRKIDFGDLRYIELPPLPPPPIKENSR